MFRVTYEIIAKYHHENAGNTTDRKDGGTLTASSKHELYKKMAEFYENNNEPGEYCYGTFVNFGDIQEFTIFSTIKFSNEVLEAYLNMINEKDEDNV